MVKTDWNASSKLDELLTEITSETPRPNSTDCIGTIHSYKIEDIRCSGPSRIIFAYEMNIAKRVVIKVLS
jgi:hypothetical protein